MLLFAGPMCCGEAYNVQPWVRPEKPKKEDTKKTDGDGDGIGGPAPATAAVNWRFPVSVMAAAGCAIGLDPMLRYAAAHVWGRGRLRHPPMYGDVDDDVYLIYLSKTGQACPVSAASYFVLYLAKTLALKIIDLALRGVSFSHAGSDNAGHLGGALFALACALAVRPAALADLAADPLGLATVAAGYVYLFLRLGCGF